MDLLFCVMLKLTNVLFMFCVIVRHSSSSAARRGAEQSRSQQRSHAYFGQ